jgi:hypothetical protein
MNNEYEMRVCFEMQPKPSPLTADQKKINNLTIQKAALMGLVDSLIDEIPSVRRREQIRFQLGRIRLITPIDLAGDLPYPEKE